MFYAPVIHTTRKAAQRELDRMPVNGFGVSVIASNGKKYSIYRDLPRMYSAVVACETDNTNTIYNESITGILNQLFGGK